MANEQMRPTSKQHAPDPSNSYERSHPEHEAGMGRLDNNDDAVPTSQSDRMHEAITHGQDPTRQLNAEDVVNQRKTGTPQSNPPVDANRQPDHSMFDEEDPGWDSAPPDAVPPRARRYPRTGGKGGTPDVGEKHSEG